MTSPIVKAISGNPIRKNVATIVYAGNVSLTNVNPLNHTNIGYHNQRKNTVVDNSVVNKAISGNSLASMTAGTYQIRTISPASILGGSDYNSRSSYLTTSVRTAHYWNVPGGSGGIYYRTGKPIWGVPVSGSQDSFGAGQNWTRSSRPDYRINEGKGGSISSIDAPILTD